MTIQRRNLDRLREAQARAESPPPSVRPGPAFYAGYEVGRYALSRDGRYGTSDLATNGALRLGQRVVLHGGLIAATPRARLEEPDRRRVIQKRGRIKFVYSVRETDEDGQQYDSLYVAGWRPGYSEQVMRIPLSSARLVNANIDNLGGDRWLVDVCYVKGAVDKDGNPTGAQTYCFAQYQNGDRAWAIELDAPKVDGKPLQITTRPLGYGFWICSWLPGKNIDQSSGQTSKSKGGCSGYGYSRQWNSTRDTWPQELIVYNGEAWGWETGDRAVGGSQWSESPPGKIVAFGIPFQTTFQGIVVGPACVRYGSSTQGGSARVDVLAAGNTGEAVSEFCRSRFPTDFAGGFYGVGGYAEACVGPPTTIGGDSWDISQGRGTLLPDYRKNLYDDGKSRNWYYSYRIDAEAMLALGESSTLSNGKSVKSFTMFSKTGDVSTRPRSTNQPINDTTNAIDEEMKLAPDWKMADIDDQSLFTVISSSATGQEITPDKIRTLQDIYDKNPIALLDAVRSQEEDLPDRQQAREWAEYILFELEEANQAPYPTIQVESWLTSPTPLLMALNEYAIVQTYRDFKLTEQHREKIYAGERIFPKRGGKTTYTIYNMSYAESDRNPVPAAKTPSSPDYNPSGSGETPSSGANGASYDKPSSANARPAL